jgi:hypothetical protein
MNTTKFNINITRQIDTYPIENSNLFFYVDTLYNNDQILKKITGFNTKDKIEEVSGTIESIKKNIVYNNITLMPFLISKENLDKYLTGRLSNLSYNVLLNPNEDNYNDTLNTIILINLSDDKLYDSQFNLLPQIISVDYINSKLNDTHYNLEACLQKLKTDKNVFNKKLEIKDIPDYNCFEMYKYIPVKYKLNAEDYTKFKNLNYHKRFEFLVDECMGLKEFKK